LSSEPRTDEAGQLVVEDAARAKLYALIGRLFYGPPDANVLAEIRRGAGAESGEHDTTRLGAAWRALQEGCGSVSPAMIRQEYDDLFVGVGRAPVTPYLFGYAEPSAPDRHLVRLRDQLTAWGFSRRNNVFEVEDHVAALSDVMRLLIEEGRPLEEQQLFFASFVYPGAMLFFAAVQQAPAAAFYKLVVAFAHAFVEVEKEAFEMVDSV
jgi:TorA maturation chaperone TorD